MLDNTPKNILHVVSVSFSLSYFVGKQFIYFHDEFPNYKFYVACSPSENLDKLSKDLDFTKIPLNITRSISPIEDIKSIFKLRKFIRDNNISIVIGHTPKGGMIAMFAAYLARVKKRVYFRHGLMYETSSGLKRIILKNIERLTGFLSTQVVCVSEEIKLISEKEKLSDLHKNFIIGKGTCNGVDSNDKYNPEKRKAEAAKFRNFYKIEPENFVLGYVGRLVKDKGINELIEAWQIITKKYPLARLLLVGPFEERDKVEDRNKALAHSDSTIIYTDFVEDASLYYSLMDAFILPSYREGFPTVILEASSMKLPIITTRSTGCSESIIDGKTGVFCEIDKYDIAKAIENFIKNPLNIRQMGSHGRDFVNSNFEQTKVWDIIKEKILK